MGRWLAAGTIVLTIIVIFGGFVHWNDQTKNVDMAETRIDPPEIEKTTKDESEQTSTDLEETQGQGRGLEEILGPFDENFQRMITRYEQKMADHLSEAETTYYNNVNTISHRELVDTYTKKADQLEEEMEAIFHERLERLENKLEENGYDTSYTLEYEWQYNAVREETRVEYIRQLISFESFSQ